MKSIKVPGGWIYGFDSNFIVFVPHSDEFKSDGFDKLEKNVRLWADSKGIPEKSDYLKQFDKLKEEVEETEQALHENDFSHAIEELGDIAVTLINTVYLLDKNMTVADCLNIAYEKISKRSGKMVDGMFVKSDDL